MKDIIVGDWVRFQRGDVLVIGVVHYVQPCQWFPYGMQAVTDAGVVHFDSILERRRVGMIREA